MTEIEKKTHFSKNIAIFELPGWSKINQLEIRKYILQYIASRRVFFEWYIDVNTFLTISRRFLTSKIGKKPRKSRKYWFFDFRMSWSACSINFNFEYDTGATHKLLHHKSLRNFKSLRFFGDFWFGNFKSLRFLAIFDLEILNRYAFWRFLIWKF